MAHSQHVCGSFQHRLTLKQTAGPPSCSATATGRDRCFTTLRQTDGAMPRHVCHGTCDGAGLAPSGVAPNGVTIVSRIEPLEAAVEAEEAVLPAGDGAADAKPPLAMAGIEELPLPPAAALTAPPRGAGEKSCRPDTARAASLATASSTPAKPSLAGFVGVAAAPRCSRDGLADGTLAVEPLLAATGVTRR